MTILTWLYLLLAILGGIVTMLFNLRFMSDYGPGFDLASFINLAFNNPASSSLSADLLIGASCISIWIYTEAKRLDMKNVWLIFLSMFTIAFAFGAPLFLFLRERHLLKIENNN